MGEGFVVGAHPVGDCMPWRCAKNRPQGGLLQIATQAFCLRRNHLDQLNPKGPPQAAFFSRRSLRKIHVTRLFMLKVLVIRDAHR